MSKLKTINRQWNIAGIIAFHGEYHSAPMRIIRLLVCCDHYDEAQIGWYFPASDTWCVNGSSSDLGVTHWMPLPKKPHSTRGGR